ncbi:MAG: N-acetyl-alpha-D-glucosaminyl L-malate synthase BshA [Candidatus Woesearchaeota archaeon]
MKKLNIVQLFYARPHLGGSGIMSMEASKELARRGHSVHIVSYPGTYLTQEEKNLGLEIHPVEDIKYPCFKAEPYNATLASQIVNVYKKLGRIDIIHANYAITHGEAALTAKDIIKNKGGDAKVVITSHGSDIHTNGHHELLAHSICNSLDRADANTFVSKSLQDEAKSLFDLKDYGSVIYNFVDENKFVPVESDDKKEEIRKILNLPERGFIVYHASNFRPLKQTELLVDAAKKLNNKQRDNIYFLLVGDGPQKEPLERLVSQYNLNERVIFMGKQNNVVPYIHASDVGILCSERESFGLALLEPMACGLPVLGSDVGGIPEVIANGESGFVFENKNVEEIVNKIEYLADNKQKTKQMGIDAYNRAIDNFSRQRIVDQYEALYNSLF